MIALCLGGAPSVWADYSEAARLVAGRKAVVIACNDAGARFRGRLDGWATLHPELFNRWREQRQGNADYRAFIHAKTPGVDAEVVPHGWYGSSGLFMAQCALEAMGASGTILCGVPLDEEAGHITGARKWPDADRYRRGFLEAAAEGAPIRSMGGWTANILGRPDEAWLDQIGA